MRLNPPIFVIGLVASALATVGFLRREATQKVDVRCDVAVAYLNYFFTQSYFRTSNEQIQLLAAPEGLRFDRVIIDRLRSGNLSEAMASEPLIGLYQQLARQDGESASRNCSSVRAFLRRRDIAVRIAGADDMPNPTDSNDHYKYPILRISMPAVDQTKGEAIMSQSLVSGLLGGGGFEIYLRRNDQGEWKVLYEKPVWIS